MACSSSLSRSWLYHVFVSFRGDDVRKGFFSYVLKDLKSKGIIPFIDNKIKRGKSVSPVLVGAIRQSKVVVVLLSRNYASSSWCLDELVEIMKCREENQQTVMTIFYEVDPSDVRKQTGDFGKAFEKTCVGKTAEVKQAWRQALHNVAGIAGYHSSNSDNEAEMINKFASDVTAVLGFTPSKDFDDFIGIGARIREIKLKLILQTELVKVIGILGPPGIGKTTTARVLCNQLSPGFSFSTFLENIRGSYEKPCGNDYQLKLRLQKNLLSQIFNQSDIEVPHLGVAEEMLSGTKVLIVLDDVDSLWQLEAMANKRGYFGSGSIIIITTEDRKLLKQLRLGIDHIYEMEFPTSDESLEIFCQYAFGQNTPFEGFKSLAWEVSRLAGKLPLGLRVMGSFLRGMSRDYWISALPRLRSSLDTEIESTLRFSYDGLSDKDKALFLHITCFFGYCKVNSVKRCLEKSGLDVDHGLQVLADKSLIYIEDGYVKMHRLLQQMGREIVKKQPLEERQFLWDTKDISDVLNEDTPLQCLKLMDLSYSTYLKEIPDLSKAMSLEILDLNGCESLLELTSSIGNATKLTVCILEGCWLFKELPSSICSLINLEELRLNSCPSLKEFSGCSSLVKLSGCSNLKELDLIYTPIEEVTLSVSTWCCLYKLRMNGCQNLKEFPNVSDSIVELVLCSTGIEEVPPRIEKLFRLRKLFMYGCQKLKTISPNISNLENLEFLGLCIEGDGQHDENDEIFLDHDTDLFEAKIEWGPNLKRSWRIRLDFNIHYIFPVCLPKKALTSPVSLCISSDGFETIPDCIRSLSGLSKLDISFCNELIKLPKLPGSLLSLDAKCCGSLTRIYSSFQNPNICLNFSHCSNLNQEARKLIQTSACKYVVLPGEEVPAHFTHRATSGSLTINLTLKPLPSSFIFKSCILLSKGNTNLEDHKDDDDDDDDDEDKNSLMSISCCVRGKQNGLIVPYGSNQIQCMPNLYVDEKHLYIFEDSLSLNQDCLEAEETTLSEFTFVFRVHDKTWKVKACGVLIVEGVLDGK